MEDVGPFAEAGGDGVVALQAVDRPFDLVAASVLLLVEADGAAASAVTAPTVGSLVLRLGNGVLDPASGVGCTRLCCTGSTTSA